MNEHLYNELKEWCNYDLKEVARTIEYFENALNDELEYEGIDIYDENGDIIEDDEISQE